MVKQDCKIAIVGGGIAGSSIALYLSELGLNVTLFEKNATLVDGPPICHLHAGGNLYREISDEQCIALLKESIELVQLYPCAVEFRPTVVAVPTNDEGNPKNLFRRLELLKHEYASLVKDEITNRVLGNVNDYYKIYTREDIETLRKQDEVKNPVHFDEWMIPVAKNIDIDKVKYPLIMVQEYGLNVFRLAASATLCLESIENAHLQMSTLVTDIQQKEKSFIISYRENDTTQEEEFDYLINAAGFRTGEIDDMLGLTRERFVEFKAAYVTKWKGDTVWPEVIFYGKRGTPDGMAQFTPYPDGYFQLHGMTEEITLFKDGLVKSDESSAQPQLNVKYVKKISDGWNIEEAKQRASLAVQHLSKFIPSFQDADVTEKPLFGAQQIPGTDPSFRAAEVSFEGERYARCENVKASSVLGMSDQITQKLIALNCLDKDAYGSRNFLSVRNFIEEDITKLAKKLCVDRNYPESLAKRSNSALTL